MYFVQMEQSVSSLAFKGSIIEAITEAKRQKKLFLVYISGDNEDSISMDKSTWSMSSVAESLSKYCILLHILEGSTDAAQFSALYPQKPAPCITAIGYNGIQLWQNEGFVSGEVLASTLEKEWLSLHVQETTASFLSAALVSRQSEQIPSAIPPSTSLETGSSSTLSVNTNDNASVDKKDADHDKKSDIDNSVTTSSKSVNQVITTAIESEIDKKPNLKAPQVVKDVKKVDIDNSDLDSNTNKSTDIHLNIRLPGGINVQEKFQPTSTLKMVKNYIDEKQESSIGPYDLAIPYPRKVFTDQDLTKTLTELSLLDRQALIIVPHLKSTGHYKPRSVIPNRDTSSVSTTATSVPDGEGYFSLWRKVLSYVNPLAYLGGNNTVQDNTQTTNQESGSGSNPGSFTGSRRSYLVTDNQINNPSSSRFGSGSNIHTLKHDEDDKKFNGKNAFWNGNSTEYGGDGENK
ncbi:plant UBX domain-containing protein 11 isoform X1 [Lactuca sativa]|uniref:plant UBX domain-containing protein 11 isoform X1 n=2 Tax=Lactuca sativa TaxID=4236 RepID=UPI001C6883FD|nr:plant UBX domain-containing protein 11 isoform X1 [Lactuca sativa]